jgi:membrane-anchored mycosin MYCP
MSPTMRGWHFDRLDLRNVWETHETRGEGVKLAILDSGVSNIRPLAHVCRLDSEGVEQDGDHDSSPDAHGTQTASLIASRDKRLLGVAPDTEIMAFGVSDLSGDPLPSLVGRAIVRAIELGAELICCPFTLTEETEEFREGLARAHAVDVPLVVAAGNEPDASVVFPVEDQAVIAVGATTSSGRLSKRFRWEPWMPVSAPGVRVPTWTGRGEISSRFSGTSASAPIVAAVAALGLARAKALDPTGAAPLEVRRQLAELLQRTSKSPKRDREINPDEFLVAISELIVS